MKISFKNKKNTETEVLITGDTDSSEVKRIVTTLEELDNDSSKGTILLKDEDGHLFRELDDVCYLYSERNKTIAKIDIEEYECKLKLYEFESYRHLGFIRVSKSYVINVKYLDRVDIEFSGNYTITMKNRDKLTLSRSYVKEFKKYLKAVL